MRDSRLDRESVNVITEIARISQNRKVYLSPGAINLHAQHVPQQLNLLNTNTWTGSEPVSSSFSG